MQNADMKLSILKQKSKHDENYRFERLYRNLFSEDFFLRAYQKIHSKEGNMTPGIDEQTIDGFNKGQITQLIELLKMERYHPKPVRRTYIPKKSGKQRPLGIPTFTDKLVQEVVRQILEAIYEPIFCESSHGFRPNRSCQTALHQIKQSGRGANWVIEGDITRFFENVNHEVLLGLLSKKIQDGRFLELIRRFLKAGYFEFKQVHNSISGTPQSGVLSPILANIYLHEFDKYMEELTKGYSKGVRKRIVPLYQKLGNERYDAKQEGNYEKANELLKQMQSMHVGDQMDEDFIRVSYCRFADDFLICIIGSKALAVEIKDKIACFMKQRLGLELNQEKTVISNLSQEHVLFLGYEIAKAHCNTQMAKTSHGHKVRSVNGKIQLLVPSQAIRDRLKPFCKDGRAYPFLARCNYPVLDIICRYNAEIQGLYNYYCLAINVSERLSRFKYYHYVSMLKTIARKEKSSIGAVFSKYGIDVPRKVGTGTRRIVGVQYETKSGMHTMTYFNDSLKRIKQPLTNVSGQFGQVISGVQLLKRLNADVCELCGADSGGMEVHHVRKLKDIVQKYRKRGRMPPNWVVVMGTIRRKTLVVCHSCHVKIHNGTL
ncbi:MAG: group II intron reverse transcriptase/maturase [Nitrososphaerota archaeon]|jgi:group II intron reverse transcriptase/maturase|nr:group II intron reverse transcriptase/maturase [Nitrososphaerota archaeon]